MKKLLLLPLVLLLFSCRQAGSASSAPENKEAEGKKPGSSTSPEQPSPVQTGPYAAKQAASIKQGIAGRAVWQQGNNMPSPDAPRSANKKGVQRTVYIYELTHGAQASATNSVFYSNIQTKLVRQVVTDANGNFAVSLAPGKYSLFSKEDEGLYANLMDGEGNIYPVEVQQGQVTSIEFLINYKASY